jgi:hypothetical protein
VTGPLSPAVAAHLRSLAVNSNDGYARGPGWDSALRTLLQMKGEEILSTDIPAALGPLRVFAFEQEKIKVTVQRLLD